MTATSTSEQATTTAQRRHGDVSVGDELAPVSFPLTVYRLVMEAGANRDFNSIHHNSEYAQATGAREMYANTSFLLGMWERAVRDWIGPAGKIHSIAGFRMRSFNYVGDTTTVTGKVVGIDDTMIRIEVTSSNSDGVTVGPGIVTVSLPE
ncbi:MAG TPA: acyl dehydratase [Streptosporangiaceae bacterium]|jgi:acyl dehydratase|nr:acyl dehydratase [Streptosporangiaceae bacterium]